MITLPAGSRSYRGSHPNPVAAHQRPSGRSHSTRTDRGGLGSAETGFGGSLFHSEGETRIVRSSVEVLELGRWDVAKGLVHAGGLNYIEPSIEEAGRYLRESGRGGWDREVALVIAFHHRIRPYRGDHARLVEPFRRADWNDFTMGLVKGGIPRDVRKAAEAELPVGDFIPKAIIRLTLGWLPRHPLRPAPVFRGGAALRRTGRG